MELSLTRIGNSQGIVLPKTLIRQFGFRDQIHVELTQHGIVLTPATPPPAHPRAGWVEQIEKGIALYGSASFKAEDPEWSEIWDDDLTEDWAWDESPLPK